MILTRFSLKSKCVPLGRRTPRRDQSPLDVYMLYSGLLYLAFSIDNQ